MKKIDGEEFKYTSEPKREKMLLDKVNELVEDNNIREGK